MFYKQTILPKLESGSGSIQTVKGIVLQSTGKKGDSAYAFYDDTTTRPDVKYAHYVISSNDVVKYSYSDTTVFISEEVFSDLAKKLFVDPKVENDKAGNHLLVVEILASNTYDAVEKNLIQFLGPLLVTYGLTTDNLWRRSDIVAESTANTPQYALLQNWTKFIQAVKDYMVELGKEDPDPNLVPQTGLVYPDDFPTFEPDTRQVKAVQGFPASEMEDEDYQTSQTGDISIKKDMFTGKVETGGGSQGSYEPIYPDFTVPPVSHTGLYNEKVSDIRKAKEKIKPVLGKIVNNQDPYPVDDKIIELEQHYPVMKMDDAVLNEIMNNTPALAQYVISLSQRSEQRVVQLENILATMMRYTFRMGSRMNINCVYYGGQSQYGKYNCIRCLADDMVNDGDIVTIDQCLNCARYEPIIGQVYGIMNDELKPDLAAILDDNQMARMSMEERIRFSRVEQMNDEAPDADTDMSEVTKKNPADKDFEEVLVNEDTQMMIWAETDLQSQTPDVNEYVYDPIAKMKRKKDLLKPDNKNKDYYSEVQKKVVPPLQNEYSIVANGTAAAGDSTGGLTEYDFTGSEKRLAIVETARQLVEMGKQEKCQYVLGGRIKDAYFSKTPQEIYDLVVKGEKLNYTSANPLRGGNVLYLDCSAFVRYCYMHNGVSIPDITGPQRAFCKVVGKAGDLKTSLAAASPGDLIFYTGHVAIYAGNGRMLHAANSHRAANDQVREGNVYSEGFISIGRHPSLNEAKAKSSRQYQVNYTLQEMAKIQLPYSTGPQGRDKEPTTVDEIMSYLDPSKHSGGKEIFQFMDLGTPIGLSLSEMQALLRSIGASEFFVNLAQSYLDGAQKYGVNEAYLAAHSCLETSNGTSSLARGRVASTGVTVYNMYGIAAYNNDPGRGKAISYALKHGWTTPAKAIEGGAWFVADKYLAKGQRTIYEMRWNPAKPGTNQYATDVAWAIKQVGDIAEIMGKAPQAIKDKIVFRTPIFK